MTSVNLEKTLEYFKIQESVLSENLTEYYLYIFIYFVYYIFFFTLKDIIQAQNKTNH